MKKLHIKKILRWLFPYLKPYRKKITIVLLLILFASACASLLPLINKYIIDNGILEGRIDIIIIFSGIAFSLFLCEKFFEVLETRLYVYTHSFLSFTMLKDTFKQILHLKLNYFAKTNASQILGNTHTDISNISLIFDKSNFFLISQVFQMIGALTGLLILDYKLTLIIVGIIPLRYVLIKTLIHKREKLFKQYITLQSDFSRWYGDIIEGIKEIKLTGMEKKSYKSFISRQRELIRIQLRLGMYDKINEAVESLVITIIINSLYIIGGWLILGGQLSLGTLMAFISYSIYLTMPVAGFLNLSYMLARVRPSFERLHSFFALETEKAGLNHHARYVTRANCNRTIVFEGVSFSYDDKRCALHNISFTIHNGEKVAIIGENGAGKSTLINLLLRFYSPDSGRILLDGIDIAEYNLKSYRTLFAVVSQDLYLFDTSILENMRPSWYVDPEKLTEAAVQSRSHSFIEQLPLKYDTRIGKNGTMLSGGQRQRLALARALARDGEIIIFDEATSQVDIEAGQLIEELLSGIFRHKTLLFITHAPHILCNMDKILILRRGTLEDVGKHTRLMQQNRYYQALLNVNQF